LSDKKPTNIREVRPPNPFDFSSLCLFLEQVLSLNGFKEEYQPMMKVMEQHANANIETAQKEQGKHKTDVAVFNDEQFEQALIRALFLISNALIRFKQKSPQEQDVKRGFLHNDNEANLKNVLTTVGFPEMFGRFIIGKRIPELLDHKISKAMIKVNSVFERAFHFQLKETELTKKSIEELLTSLKQFTEEEDLKQYLETLLYKVEVATTEKSFNVMKSKIAEPLQNMLKLTQKELATVEQGGAPSVPLAGRTPNEYFAQIQTKMELLKEYIEEYFGSDDFIFVEKNLLQFKKAKAEQQDRNSKPIFSDEFSSGLDKKLMIQLISAFKKTYNSNELAALKYFLIKDLLGDSSGEMSEQELTKFLTKKKLALDALKRIRQDMIVEDTCNTASENKKTTIETFEQELTRLNPQQLKTQVLPVVTNKADEILSRAKRVIKKKQDSKDEDKGQFEAFQREVEETSLNIVRTIIDMHKYNMGGFQNIRLQTYTERINPLLKKVEHTIKKMEKGPEQQDLKTKVQAMLRAFYEASIPKTKLNQDQTRLFQTFLKGLVDRVSYW
jgi:hypothetical protein